MTRGNSNGPLPAVVWCLAVVIVSPSHGAGEQNGRLLEGFEDLRKVLVTGGALKAVKTGTSVTQGKQAAKIPPGGGIEVAIRREDVIDSSQWLKLDTVTVEPLPHPVWLHFRGPGVETDVPAYVQPAFRRIA